VRPPTLTRRLTIIGNQNPGGGSSQWAVIGDVTGTIYGTFDPSQHIPWYVAIEPGIDPTYTLRYQSGSGASLNIWVIASFTNPLIDTNPATPIQIQGSPNTFPPINVSGSPVGIFKTSFHALFASGTGGQVVLAAPGSGLSYYIQTVCVSNLSAAVAGAGFYAAGFSYILFAEMPPNTGQAFTYPGGFEMPSNTGLRIDTAGGAGANTTLLSLTYTIGPTI
jgi:hypothetical protein